MLSEKYIILLEPRCVTYDENADYSLQIAGPFDTLEIAEAHLIKHYTDQSAYILPTWVYKTPNGLKSTAPKP